MSKENTSIALEDAVEQLEHHRLENNRTRSQNYLIVQNFLERGVIDNKLLDRILIICVRDIQEDVQFVTHVVNIISTVLKKIKAGEYENLPNLIPCALGIIHLIITVASLNNVVLLKTMCVETFMLFPDDVLVTIVTEHCDTLMELFNIPGQAWSHLEFRVLTYDILYKLLIILSHEKKKEFVKEGLSFWFSKTIPTIVTYSTNGSLDNLKPIEVLELLTDVIVTLNYTDCPQWLSILECICNSNKYPKIMTILLEKGNPGWYRLWIVFIRLLNNQITRNTCSAGTPINSMLPVVETAFKMDATNRCKAFKCWSVLIENFSKETNEHCIMKRLKLLVIPLRLNNAKVEETAIAKFDAWWHLITKFQTKLDKFIDVVMVSFLHFCFGKHNSSGRTTFIPGQLSDTLKKLGVQAFVEIVGHVKCDGCTTLPRLRARLINTKYLIDFWKDWVHSMKMAMKFSLDNGNKRHVLCLWKSFLLTIHKLPDSNVKRDVLNELLTILRSSLQDSRNENDVFDDLIFNVAVSSLFEDDFDLKQCLRPKDDEEKGSLNIIIAIITDPSLKSVYERLTIQETVEKLEPLTDFIVNDLSKCASINFIKKTLHNLPSNDTTLTFWTVLADSICSCEYEICSKDLYHILVWPLKSTNMFTNVKYAAKMWYKIYETNFLSLSKTDIHKDILISVQSCNIVMHSSIYFTLHATIAILKNGLSKRNSIEYEKEAELLKTLLSRIDNYETIEELFPTVVDTLVVMLSNVTNMVNENFTEATLMSVKIVLKLMIPVLKRRSDISNIVTLLKILLTQIKALFDVESYSNFSSVIVDTLKQDYVSFENQLLLKDVVQSILKKSTKNEKDNKPIQDSIDLTLDNVESETKSNTDKFMTPNIKDVPKKCNKKENSIVSTTVENGEEFVVVKSNWKFNPRKLTENQKEKLQRKREDIPALYQDLSQSQDEFKLKTWKTDSQDNSSTSKSNSKSTSEGVDTSDILKKLVSTEVVPKIMENILAENNKKEVDEHSHNLNNSINQQSSKLLTTLTPKSKKTPRMALKDRIFRNVRNLIEKSTTPISNKDNNCDQIGSIPKTPPSKPNDAGNIANSAPSLLLCDRPSRVKRKPRKFDDSELCITKKRRHSQSDCPTNENLEINLPKDNIAELVETIENSGEKENTSFLPDLNTEKCEENLDDVNVTNVTSTERYTFIETIQVENLKSEIPEENITCIDNTKVKISRVPSTEKEQDNLGKQQSNTANNSKEKLEPDKESNTPIQDYDSKEVHTRKHVKSSTENEQQTPSAKKSNGKKSRIEKELAIDMVEGHPFLNTPTTSEKRKTRKNLSSPINCVRKKKLVDKLNMPKPDPKSPLTVEKKERGKSGLKKSNIDIVHKIDERCVNSPDSVFVSEESCSEDIIESSQDSTLTAITVIKKTPKRLPVVSIEKMKINVSNEDCDDTTQNLLFEANLGTFSDAQKGNIFKETTQEKTKTIERDNNNGETERQNKNVTNVMETEEITPDNVPIAKNGECSFVSSDSLLHQETKDDTEFPRNKTAVEEKNEFELTENMDTESIIIQDTCEDVMTINDDEHPVISVSSGENIVGTQTQEIANADTQPNETTDVDIKLDSTDSPLIEESEVKKDERACSNDVHLSITDNTTISLNTEKPSDVSSPFKDDVQRKQDFLNNTLEISPIKTVSPDREKKSPSPDSSNDYVVIKLSSPVQSNGEPFEKGSPEFFTEDKTSPDKRDQSPPRSEVTVTNTSPSSSLSLKKNRPQVRSGGRAAQMLGLCVPDKLNPIMNSERLEVDEGRKSSPCNTPARRNLRILYNSVSDTSDNLVENEENESFLKLKRMLPSVGSSPSGPILKRKLAEITDDATISPANKRKRVSFHDPPVSTTITVQKYIEPCGVRSPQSSALKRQERQARMQVNLKSPKRLDNLFSLETVLTKTVESFTDVDLSLSNSDDTQMASMDQTPAAEIVKTSELNDTDPICPELLDCKDLIANIATELSSPAMKDLLIRELEGKVETIGDLANMTELEVNRLCIKAPKINVAKKVLSHYATKVTNNKAVIEIAEKKTAVVVEIAVPPKLQYAEIAVQTNELLSTDTEMQTCDVPMSLVSTQTEEASTSTIAAQTDESGSKTTAEIIQACLVEKSDFVAQLSEELPECSVQQIANKLSFAAATDTLMSKIDSTNSTIVLERLLNQHTQEMSESSNKQLAFVRDYLCDKFDSKDLIMFCSELLKNVYNKQT